MSISNSPFSQFRFSAFKDIYKICSAYNIFQIRNQKLCLHTGLSKISRREAPAPAHQVVADVVRAEVVHPRGEVRAVTVHQAEAAELPGEQLLHVAVQGVHAAQPGHDPRHQLQLHRQQRLVQLQLGGAPAASCGPGPRDVAAVAVVLAPRVHQHKVALGHRPRGGDIVDNLQC